jgi:hypothetical protein
MHGDRSSPSKATVMLDMHGNAASRITMGSSNA